MKKGTIYLKFYLSLLVHLQYCSPPSALNDNWRHKTCMRKTGTSVGSSKELGRDGGYGPWPALAACLLGIAGFGLDLALPLGAVAGMPYAILVMAGWFAEGRRFALLAAAGATILTFAGHMLSPPGGDPWIDFTNRAIALVVVWCLVFLVSSGRARGEAAARIHKTLADRITAGEAELQETRDALLRSERLAAVGQRAGTAAHELRNPLGVLVTSINVIEIKARQAGLDIEAALARAHRAIRRCETIIDEYLDAARAKGHRPKPQNLDGWLSAQLDEIATGANIALMRDFQAGDTVVHIDPDSFLRTLVNLIDNARQALSEKPGGGTVTVGSRRYGGDAEIFVADDGPGIPAELLARVTETLFSTRPYGTGLGLPAVRRIMEEHGGSMAIESAPGRGTRVTLRLPAPGQIARPGGAGC